MFLPIAHSQMDAKSTRGEDLELLVANTITKCAEANGITAAQVIGLRLTPDKSSVQASPALKCFTKCVIDETGLVGGGGIHVDRAVAISVAQGNEPAKARRSAERCAALYKPGHNSCNDFWKLYVCFHS